MFSPCQAHPAHPAATVSTQRTIPIGEIERAASLPGVTVMNLGSATKDPNLQEPCFSDIAHVTFERGSARRARM